MENQIHCSWKCGSCIF